MDTAVEAAALRHRMPHADVVLGDPRLDGAAGPLGRPPAKDAGREIVRGSTARGLLTEVDDLRGRAERLARLLLASGIDAPPGRAAG